jgi:hypothetical protein
MRSACARVCGVPGCRREDGALGRFRLVRGSARSRRSDRVSDRLRRDRTARARVAAAGRHNTQREVWFRARPAVSRGNARSPGEWDRLSFHGNKGPDPDIRLVFPSARHTLSRGIEDRLRSHHGRGEWMSMGRRVDPSVQDCGNPPRRPTTRPIPDRSDPALPVNSAVSVRLLHHVRRSTEATRASAPRLPAVRPLQQRSPHEQAPG